MRLSGKHTRLIRPDRQIVFAYYGSNLEHGQMAKRPEMQQDILKMKLTQETR